MAAAPTVLTDRPQFPGSVPSQSGDLPITFGKYTLTKRLGQRHRHRHREREEHAVVYHGQRRSVIPPDP